MSKKILWILAGLAGLFLFIQLFRIDKTNPAVQPEQDFLYLAAPAAELGFSIKATCYDCHSHETVYPWYSNVAPVSWWLKNHIDEAREHLNFSTWGTLDPEERTEALEEAAEEVKEGHMPLRSYLWLHPEARLTDEQRRQIAEWFGRQMEINAAEGEVDLQTRPEPGEEQEEEDEH